MRVRQKQACVGERNYAWAFCFLVGRAAEGELRAAIAVDAAAAADDEAEAAARDRFGLALDALPVADGVVVRPGRASSLLSPLLSPSADVSQAALPSAAVVAAAGRSDEDEEEVVEAGASAEELEGGAFRLPSGVELAAAAPGGAVGLRSAVAPEGEGEGGRAGGGVALAVGGAAP